MIHIIFPDILKQINKQISIQNIIMNENVTVKFIIYTNKTERLQNNVICVYEKRKSQT